MANFICLKDIRISFNGIDVSTFEEEEIIENPTADMIETLGGSIEEVEVEEDTENDPDLDSIETEVD